MQQRINFYSFDLIILFCITLTLTYRYGRFYSRLHNVGWRTSIDWASEKLSHVWVRPFLEDFKIVASRDRTHAESELA